MLMLLFALLSVLFVVPRDFAVMLREHLNGLYRINAYMPATIITDTPVQIVMPCIYCTIVYWSVGLNRDSSTTLMFYAMMILLSNIGSSVAFFLSAATGSLSSSLQIAPAIFIPNVMFSGFVLDLDSITWVLRWVQYVTFLKYAWAVVTYNELHGLTLSCESETPAQCQFSSGDDVLKYYNIYDVNVTGYFLILAAFMVFFRAAAVISMVIRTRSYTAKRH